MFDTTSHTSVIRLLLHGATRLNKQLAKKIKQKSEYDLLLPRYSIRSKIDNNNHKKRSDNSDLEELHKKSNQVLQFLKGSTCSKYLTIPSQCQTGTLATKQGHTHVLKYIHTLTS